MFGSARLINLASLALFKTSSVNVIEILSLYFVVSGVMMPHVCAVCILTFHVHMIIILIYSNTYSIFIDSLHWCMCVCVSVCVLLLRENVCITVGLR